MPNFTPIGATITVEDHKTEIFADILSKFGIQTLCRGVSLARFARDLQILYRVSGCINSPSLTHVIFLQPLASNLFLATPHRLPTALPTYIPGWICSTGYAELWGFK